MAETNTNFDISKYLEDEESVAAYLSAVIEEGDANLLLTTIGDIARARGMAKIASDPLSSVASSFLFSPNR